MEGGEVQDGPGTECPGRLASGVPSKSHAARFREAAVAKEAAGQSGVCRRVSRARSGAAGDTVHAPAGRRAGGQAGLARLYCQHEEALRRLLVMFGQPECGGELRDVALPV